MGLNFLFGENSSIYSLSKKKRSYSEHLLSNKENISGDGFFSIDDTEKVNSNTTNHTISTFMIIYFIKGFYYVCFYDSLLREVQFLEQIQQSKIDDNLFKNILIQFKPVYVICNNRVKFQINFSEKEIGYKLNIDIKSSKEFSYDEGNTFLNDLAYDLDNISQTENTKKLKSFTSNLKLSHNYNCYCSLMSAFALNFELLSVNSTNFTKLDMIVSMKYTSINGFLSFDLESLASIDVIKFNKENTNKKTVMDLFNKTFSTIGTSLLNSYLLRPLCDIEKIRLRQNAVESIIYELDGGAKQSLIKQLMDLIQTLSDIPNILHSLRIGNYKEDVWRKLRNFLINIIKMKNLIEQSDVLLKSSYFLDFVGNIVNEDVNLIRQKIEDKLDFTSELNCVNIKNNIDVSLDEYRLQYGKLETIFQDISYKLTKQLGVEVILAYIPQFGYLIAIMKEEVEELNLGNNFEFIFKTETTKYYKNEKMIQMDQNYGDLYSLIRDKEIEILINLKNQIIDDVAKLIPCYTDIGHIDVLICFANVSLSHKFNKPNIVSKKGIIELKGSFHPLLDGSHFISNDLVINKNIVGLTGPNYSGKSTLLTQIGITVYLSQIGCFIPAEFGNLSIFESILTRVNSMDSVNCSKSTFLKDCEQMSKCINRSTDKSLILIDEFGKGTDINDGPGLLAGVVKHFVNRGSQCPTVLISTHLSEIFNQEDNNIKFYFMKVMVNDKSNFDMTYLYELHEGIARQSMGLYCAKQNGISAEIIKKAQYIIKSIDEGKDIVEEFSRLDEKEMDMVRDGEEKMKQFLKLDFQEWDKKDGERLRMEILKILK